MSYSKIYPAFIKTKTTNALPFVVGWRCASIFLCALMHQQKARCPRWQSSRDARGRGTTARAGFTTQNITPQKPAWRLLVLLSSRAPRPNDRPLIMLFAVLSFVVQFKIQCNYWRIKSPRAPYSASTHKYSLPKVCKTRMKHVFFYIYVLLCICTVCEVIFKTVKYIYRSLLDFIRLFSLYLKLFVSGFYGWYQI